VFLRPSDQTTFVPSLLTMATSILLVLEAASEMLTGVLGKACSRVFLSLAAGVVNPQLLQYSMLIFCDILLLILLTDRSPLAIT
jgi:hypothetical protein